MTISTQSTASHNLNLALPVEWDFVPLPDRRLANPERASQSGLRSEMLDGVLFFHDAKSMAYRTDRRKNAILDISYAQGMAAETITDRIKAIILESGMKDVEIARQTGISKQSVGDWKNGRSVHIKPDNLLAFADAFGIEIRWLISGKGPKSSRDKPRDEKPPDVQRATDLLREMPEDQRKAVLILLESLGNAA